MVCRLDPRDCACGICDGGHVAPEGYFGGTWCPCECHALKGDERDKFIAKRRTEQQAAADKLVENAFKNETLDKQETPRTDAALSHLNLPNGTKIGIPVAITDLCRQLEREADHHFRNFQAQSDARVTATHRAEKAKRELADCLQQYERVKAERNGAIDRAQLCLDAKNNWADRARAAEAAVSARTESQDVPLGRNELVCLSSEYHQLTKDARRYEWLRDHMRRMPMGEQGTRHFFDQADALSFQEAVDEAMSQYVGEKK